MKLEMHEKSQKIVNFGDDGESFFIILKGSVGVYLPDRERVPDKVFNKRVNQSLDLKSEITKYANRL